MTLRAFKNGHRTGRNSSPKAPGVESPTFTETRKFVICLQTLPFLHLPALELLCSALCHCPPTVVTHKTALLLWLKVILKVAPKISVMAKRLQGRHGATPVHVLMSRVPKGRMGDLHLLLLMGGLAKLVPWGCLGLGETSNPRGKASQKPCAGHGVGDSNGAGGCRGF